MVRLVKGAYWDSEIKQAQILGLDNYPVFTRKENTDICYIACAKKLLDMRDYIYPQFATHNAHSVAAVRQMAGGDHQSYEFQRLHGMGEALMEEIMAEGGSRCRIYAPVGAHKDLLAYLVRRLLENGANSSFVHQIIDESVPPHIIAADPFEAMSEPAENPNIPFPKDLFGKMRLNSHGIDLEDRAELARIEKGRAIFKHHIWQAGPLIIPIKSPSSSTQKKKDAVFNPAKLWDQIGIVENTNAVDINAAIMTARNAQPEWERLSGGERAAVLNRASDLYEKHAHEFYALLAREAGKTIADCVGELREAVDFLRFYANEAIRLEIGAKARGVFVCISPWNFPLAIFTGQIAAALAAGNAVMAKPAEQTPIVAYRATQFLHEAGVPKDILQLVPGEGPVIGKALTSNANISGVCFTGSTATAQLINQNMARYLAPDAPLIAETGGINVMIVDSTALPQQAVGDVLMSAFQSAGQRCSACRLLYLQSNIADEFIDMLEGAMTSLNCGDPWQFDCDIGPLIDRDAYEEISSYINSAANTSSDNFLLAPSIKKISNIGDLEREIFGPVLHVATYEAGEINQVIDEINATQYGLTFGLHTRIEGRVEDITRRIKCGNIYINRNQIGAIVGSQPFGGEGLSGTGPKAGGPNYLGAFMTKNSQANFSRDNGEKNGFDDDLEFIALTKIKSAIEELSQGVGIEKTDLIRLLQSDKAKIALMMEIHAEELPGPTGESNILNYAPKGIILCLGPSSQQADDQALAALGAGCSVVVICKCPSPGLFYLHDQKAPIKLMSGKINPEHLINLKNLGGVVMAPCEEMGDVRTALAKRKGAIISIISDIERRTSFLHERHTCIDTTAAGGNAALMVEAG